MHTNYQQCKQCVMDTSDPDITFNSIGICNHCQTYEERKRLFILPLEQRKRKLDSIISYCRTKGKGKPYDCIIGISGGVDSTYVAYLVKTLGLRPLAVHLDNGWNSELAISNIKNVLANLGIELYTYVLDWEEFKSLQLAFLKASTPDSEIPSDHAITALMRQLAAEYDVPMIWGVNFNSESILPTAWAQGHTDWGYIKRVNKIFGNKKLHNYPHYSVIKLIYYKRFKRQKTIDILNHIDYDKEKAKEFLIKELGWRDYGGKHHESIYTRIFQTYILPIKFGYDKRRAHYSSLILAGQMNRDEAINMLKELPYNPITIDKDIEYLIKKLEVDCSEFNEIMNSEIKFYQDFSPTFPKKVAQMEKKLTASLLKYRRSILSLFAKNNPVLCKKNIR